MNTVLILCVALFGVLVCEAYMPKNEEVKPEDDSSMGSNCGKKCGSYGSEEVDSGSSGDGCSDGHCGSSYVKPVKPCSSCGGSGTEEEDMGSDSDEGSYKGKYKGKKGHKGSKKDRKYKKKYGAAYDSK